MKDFDTDPTTRRAQRINPENLLFKIGGREFHVVSGYAPDSPGGSALDEWNTITIDTPNVEFAAIADRTILQFLKPGQGEAWKTARDPDAENPITGADLVDIVHWLVEAVVNRPLVSSSESSAGSTPPATQPSVQPETTGRHLTVALPSKAGTD
jgi:hypothetical protein